MADDLEERKINLGSENEKKQVAAFLESFQLRFDEEVDYTIALFRRGEIVAAGSLSGYVLRNIAVAETLQAEGLMTTIVSRLICELWRRGYEHYFVYTQPDKSGIFQSLGFTEIGRALPYAVLLESGVGSVPDYCGYIRKETAGLKGEQRAAAVVNCNPFTLGHRALIAQAAEENEGVIVFVVAEDRSLFPYVHRLRMVQAGLAGLGNVAVVKGEKYIISGATFPGYFTRDEERALAQTSLDADVFGRNIARALRITKRYVGEEPYCRLTAGYNQAMLRVLPAHGVEVKIIPRLAVDGEIVSASQVRELIRRERWSRIRELVPPSTYDYLVSPGLAAVIEKIKGSNSRHRRGGHDRVGQADDVGQQRKQGGQKGSNALYPWCADCERYLERAGSG